MPSYFLLRSLPSLCPVRQKPCHKLEICNTGQFAILSNAAFCRMGYQVCMLTSVHGSSFLVEAAARMGQTAVTRMYNRKQGFSDVARMPQSVEPWTNGGLCDVCQPSHGNFLLADLSNSITYQLAKQRALLLYIVLVFNLGSQGVATTAPACRCG